MSAKHKIMMYILGAFLIPPIGWVLVCWYATLWSFEEMLAVVVFEPYILAYIIPFITTVLLYSQRKLSFLDANQHSSDPEITSRVQAGIALLPKMILLFMIVYCLFGPMVSMISTDSIDRVKWIICEVLGIPFILLFSIPFIILIIYRLETWMRSVPLPETRRVISFSARIYFTGVMNICGLIICVILVMVAIAYSHQGESNLFGLMLRKAIPVAVVGILIGVFNSALVTRIVTKTTLDAVALAEAIARGDLRESLELRSADEMGRLTLALNNMVQSLREQAKRTLEEVSVLASSAAEISTAATELGTVASKTSRVVSETSSIMAQLERASQMTAEKCKEVAESAQHAVRISERGRSATAETSERMSLIKQQMQSIGEIVIKLSDHSRSIGDIIDTVRGLANQSHLLAVNASIEAARAGDHGKGFAVVAQEIKTLAEQSKESTEQISTILDDIRQWIGSDVMATEQGGKAVELGLQQSLTAGQSIERLSATVKTSHEVTAVIENASGQQAAGAEQVAHAMSVIQESMQQNLAGINQMASAADRIAELGSSLRDMVDQYRM